MINQKYQLLKKGGKVKKTKQKQKQKQRQTQTNTQIVKVNVNTSSKRKRKPSSRSKLGNNKRTSETVRPSTNISVSYPNYPMQQPMQQPMQNSSLTPESIKQVYEYIKNDLNKTVDNQAVKPKQPEELDKRSDFNISKIPDYQFDTEDLSDYDIPDYDEIPETRDHISHYFDEVNKTRKMVDDTAETIPDSQAPQQQDDSNGEVVSFKRPYKKAYYDQLNEIYGEIKEDEATNILKSLFATYNNNARSVTTALNSAEGPREIDEMVEYGLKLKEIPLRKDKKREQDAERMRKNRRQGKNK